MTLENIASFSILVHNPIFSPSTADLGGGDIIQNAGFETAGGGGADVFADWVENTDTGNATITQATATPAPHGGSSYCEIYSVNGGDVNGSVSQDVTVSPGDRYRLTVWSRTSDIFASMQGRWSVYDNTNAAWIVNREGTSLFSSSEWQQSSLFFTVPSGCTSIKIYLYQNIDSDSYVYYDDIKLESILPGSIGVLGNYNNMINSYSHSSSVNVGYDTMSMEIAGDLTLLSDWIEHGLGRHIVVSEASSGVIWEGFVNLVTLTAGGFTMTVGPMVDIINRARIVYNQLDWNTNPPIGGDTVVAQWNDELTSQGRYGILEGLISGGEGTADEMLELVNSLIPEIAWAPSESNISLSSGGRFSASVECLGYGHLLNKYYYTQVFQAGEYNASSKIFDILQRDPNNLFKYGLKSSISENTIQVERYEDGQKTALAILKETANLGDASDNRHVFGVYTNREFIYGAVPETIAYKTRLSDGRIELFGGGFIDPWEVKPGNWIKVNDISIGKFSSSVRSSEDPSLIFIESVVYNSPYSISISSGRASTFRQKLDRLGLGGI